MTVALTHFAGRAGDHNERAMQASALLAQRFAHRLSTTQVVVGSPQPALSTGWREELIAARATLREMADRYQALLVEGMRPVTAMNRCAVALATLPVVAEHRPDAVVVWFDAHADLNTPASTTTGYLGGLALSGPLGLWDSGLGAGLDTNNAVLVGARDIDLPEQELVDRDRVTLVAVGPDMAAQLQTRIAGRPVYVHIDCDVLAPGIAPTDYQVPGGMTLAQLHACAVVLSAGEIVGLEVGELETGDDPGDASPAHEVVAALEPLLATLRD